MLSGQKRNVPEREIGLLTEELRHGAQVPAAQSSGGKREYHPAIPPQAQAGQVRGARRPQACGNTDLRSGVVQGNHGASPPGELLQPVGPENQTVAPPGGQSTGSCRGAMSAKRILGCPAAIPRRAAGKASAPARSRIAVGSAVSPRHSNPSMVSSVHQLAHEVRVAGGIFQRQSCNKQSLVVEQGSVGFGLVRVGGDSRLQSLEGGWSTLSSKIRSAWMALSG